MTANESYINKIHEELLSIMDSVDVVCRENGITYYITAGTLLGAVRHKGIIPWDDDFDIVMPRKDYEHFLELKMELKTLHLVTVDENTSPEYSHLFAKVYKEGTEFLENDSSFGHWGIFVDIFPLENADYNLAYLDKNKKRIIKVLNGKQRKFKKAKSLKDKIARIPTYQLYTAVIKCLCSKAGTSTSKYYVNFGSQYDVKRQTMPKEWFGRGTLLEMNGHKYNAPEQYTKVLESIYGPNYMQIPPVEKRRSHYPKMVRFSDGEELYFDEVEHKVTVEDTLK